VRVFVLNTGRCGSSTFVRACEHLTNFTAGHETNAKMSGVQRFAYPDDHVEADNRLAWFLGGLSDTYSDAPLYVHLRRDPEAVARSFLRRFPNERFGANIIRAFANGIVMRRQPWPEEERLDVCRFYVETVTANIEGFLADKPRRMTVWLEDSADWFPTFWESIGAEGDLGAAMSEFAVRHNAS
jgi:hypothetical protein